jgi:hypothetical protein
VIDYCYSTITIYNKVQGLQAGKCPAQSGHVLLQK